MMCQLKEKNPALALFSVHDPAFAEYGTVLTDFDTDGLCSACRAIDMPQAGSAYRASVPELEALPAFAVIRDGCFGGMPIQIGLCWGYNTALDALEYHKCTEINIAATDMLLFLGRMADCRDGLLDSSQIKAFFVPRGTAAELSSSTLHYCPCQTGPDGFYAVVILIRGTNGERTFRTADKRLIGQNKWVLWHKEAAPADGFIGITGKNLNLVY